MSLVSRLINFKNDFLISILTSKTNSLKKPASSVPSLPVVNGNTNNANGYIRPLSVENGHSQKPKLNSNSTSNLNEFRSPASSTFSTPSSTKSDAGSKSNKNGNSNPHSSINFDNSEEFGLSVTKIDNNSQSQDANKSNGTPNNKNNNSSSNGIAKKRVRKCLKLISLAYERSSFARY